MTSPRPFNARDDAPVLTTWKVLGIVAVFFFSVGGVYVQLMGMNEQLKEVKAQLAFEQKQREDIKLELAKLSAHLEMQTTRGKVAQATSD